VPGITFLTLPAGESKTHFTLLFGLLATADYYYQPGSYASAGLGITGALNPANKTGHHIVFFPSLLLESVTPLHFIILLREGFNTLIRFFLTPACGWN